MRRWPRCAPASQPSWPRWTRSSAGSSGHASWSTTSRAPTSGCAPPPSACSGATSSPPSAAPTTGASRRLAGGGRGGAEVDLLEAARHFDQGMPERRDGAVIRLAGLRVRQGRLEEAALLLQGLEQHPDVVPTLAALHLARGDTALARDLLERATEGS